MLDKAAFGRPAGESTIATASGDRAAWMRHLLAIAGFVAALFLAAAPAATAQTYSPPFYTGGEVGARPFNELYYAQIHNTYAHSNKLTNWLDAGYRAFEIDVIDREDWEKDVNGPYVSHNLDPEKANCNDQDKQRLANCFDAILTWLKDHNSGVPIVVLVDMKASWDPASAWKSDEVADLDKWIKNYLGNRMYKYTDLRTALGGTWGGDMRALLKEKGWPAARSIETSGLRGGLPQTFKRSGINDENDKIIVGLTGGHIGSVNQNMRDAVFHHLDRSPATFMCPDVDAGDPDEISKAIDGMSESDSSYFICANLKAGDHMETTLNRSSDYKQMIHIWDKSGNFSTTDYAYNYMTVAQGGSIIGWDTSIGLSSSDTFTPDWTDSIPLVGLRRSVPGYFEMIDEATGECTDVSGGTYGNGSAIVNFPCNGQDNQKWVYTAEGQLRPKGNNKYCLDIDGGKTSDGKKLHLWDCDGGKSEKWAINKTGHFKSMYDTGYCMSVRSNDNHTFEVKGCDQANKRQIFKLRKVANWLPSNY